MGSGPPIRVLYFVEYYRRFTGAQRSLLLLLKNLPRDSVESVVLFPGEGMCTERYREAGLRVLVEPPPPVLDQFGGALARLGVLGRARVLGAAVVPYAVRLRRIMRELGVDLLHFNTARGLVMAGLAGALSRIPMVLHVRGMLPRIGRPEAFLRDHLPDRMILVADAIRSSMSPATLGKCRTVHNGVFMPSESASRTREALLERWGVSEYPTRPDVLAVIVGSLVPFKGAHHVIDAVDKLRAVDIASADRLRIVFVGDRPDQAYGELLDRRVAELGLGNVHFAGWDDEPADWFRACDVSILSTVQRETLQIAGERRLVVCTEGLPRAVLEAMSHGKPVVATRVAGVPEQILDGEHGLLVKPGDAGDLADALRRIVGDPDLRHRLGHAAEQRVAEDFSIEAMVRRTLAVYRELLPLPGDA